MVLLLNLNILIVRNIDVKLRYWRRISRNLAIACVIVDNVFLLDHYVLLARLSYWLDSLFTLFLLNFLSYLIATILLITRLLVLLIKVIFGHFYHLLLLNWRSWTPCSFRRFLNVNDHRLSMSHNLLHLLTPNFIEHIFNFHVPPLIIFILSINKPNNNTDRKCH